MHQYHLSERARDKESKKRTKKQTEQPSYISMKEQLTIAQKQNKK